MNNDYEGPALSEIAVALAIIVALFLLWQAAC